MIDELIFVSIVTPEERRKNIAHATDSSSENASLLRLLLLFSFFIISHVFKSKLRHSDIDILRCTHVCMATWWLSCHSCLLLMLSRLCGCNHLWSDSKQSHTFLGWASDQLLLIILNRLPNFDVAFGIKNLLMSITACSLIHLGIVRLCSVCFIPIVLFQELDYHVNILSIQHDT